MIIILALISVLFTNNSSFASVDNKEPEPLKGSTELINLKSDQVEYFQETDQFVATGNVVITVESDGTVIYSDEVIYDRPNEEMISQKNVKIVKDGTTIYGDYAKFDLAKDSAIINNPDARLRQIKIDAETAKVHSGDIDAFKGKIIIDQQDVMLVLSAGAVGGVRNKEYLQKRPGQESRFKYDIDAKEVIVEDTEFQNVITLRHASIKINKFQIAKIPSLKLIADNENTRIETTLPEFGHLREVGSFLGYGHVFNLPKGSTLKALPIFTFGDGDGSSIGIGGMGRFMNSSNRTELYYSSLRKNVVYRGEQKLFTPHTKFQYAQNAYVENGFFGRQMPGFIWEVVDDRTLIEEYNMRFSLRSSGGLVEKNQGNYSTARFQVQGNLANIAPLWSYGLLEVDEKLEGNVEDRNYISAGFGANFSIAAYGTGDTYGVVRAGPTLYGKLGNLDYWMAYYQGDLEGETPFLVDQYRYGKSNYVFRGTLKVNEKLTVGYMTSLNLTEDNWEEDLITENQLFFWIGPEDLKFKVGYDIERATTLFGFDMLVGAENSALDFEKLKVIQR